MTIGAAYCATLSILQELVNKETPMKPYKWVEEAEWYDAFDEVEHYECPKCYNELCCPLKGTSITRCDKCGQAIGWGYTND